MKDQPTLLDKAINAYEAGYVQRYHTHPRFARFGQNDGHHSYGVAALMIVLHPHPSAELLRVCITHDQGERFAGDLAAPCKRDNPDLAKEHAALERLMLMKYFDRANPDLRDIDYNWLKMVDMLECYMFASLTIPEALDTHAWSQLGEAIEARAEACDPAPRLSVRDLMQTAKNRAGFKEAPDAGEYE